MATFTEDHDTTNQVAVQEVEIEPTGWGREAEPRPLRTYPWLDYVDYLAMKKAGRLED